MNFINLEIIREVKIINVNYTTMLLVLLKKIKKKFIHLEIIEEEKYIYFFFKKIYKNSCNLVKSLGTTTTFKPNFYYIVYDILKNNN